MPIYVFNDFLGVRNSAVVLLDCSLDCSQLQEQFRRKVDGTWIHMVYCSKELYDVNTSKLVHEFDLPPLCIQLYHNHLTALMYKSESSLQLIPFFMDGGIEESDSSVVFFALSFIISSLN